MAWSDRLSKQPTVAMVSLTNYFQQCVCGGGGGGGGGDIGVEPILETLS